jgi:cytochrome b561
MIKQMAYTPTAVTLHWLVAVLVFITFPVGLIMHEMVVSPDKLRLLSYHKWLGVTVFALVMVRLIWRATHHPAAMLESMPSWQRMVANAVHTLLYLLLLAIPLSGWLMSSAKGFQTVYLGILPLPDLLDKDKVLGEALSVLHQVLNTTLLILVVSHVLAALKHQFIDRDNTLSRMLPFVDERLPK